MSKKFAIKINKITKYFDEKLILDKVDFSLYFGEKVALIGPNGSGKSTLSKIILGEEKQDSGTIEVFKEFKISYLPQEFNKDILVERYLEMEKRVSDERRKIFELFDDFGFSEEILRSKISSLSGGEKTKIFLIKVTLENSDIIILDEPTNNLDSDGLDYLEKIINNSKSSFLIISHDRNFLDNTVSKIISLDGDFHSIKIYDGNYSSYIYQKEQSDERDERLYGENQRRKKKIEEEIKINQGKAFRKETGVKVNSDNDKLGNNLKKSNYALKASGALKNAKNKLKNFDELERVKNKRPLIIDFSEMKNSGVNVLKIENLILNFGFKEKINYEIFSGDRVLISGKNGSGKSTLIKTILDYKEYSEEIIWGSNIKLGYLPQNLNYGKDDEKFIDYFLEETGKNITEARKVLKRFGFFDEEVVSKINSLSPGMRARGKIALMLADNPNVLILDEPTNNLDLEVLEEFEKALKKYKGTIIFVSHDKYFIEKISPNKILEL